MGRGGGGRDSIQSLVSCFSCDFSSSVEGVKVLVLGDGWRKRRSKTRVGLAPTGYYSNSVRLNIKSLYLGVWLENRRRLWACRRKRGGQGCRRSRVVSRKGDLTRPKAKPVRVLEGDQGCSESGEV